MDESTLKSHLECNICLEIPVGIHIYVCKQGHDICGNCYNKLHVSRSNAKKLCPNCRTKFDNPPARNRTVEGLIANSGILKDCPNKSFGCQYRGDSTTLSLHVSHCPEAPVECLEYNHCIMKVAPKHMLCHLKNNHQNVVFSKKFSIQKWLMKSNNHLLPSKTTSWNLVICEEFGEHFGIRIVKTKESWFTWIVLLGEEKEASRFKCVIKVKNAKDPKTCYAYSGRVCSIAQSSILENGFGLSLSHNQVLSSVTNSDISESSRRAGFDRQLPISYFVERKTDTRRPGSSVGTATSRPGWRL